MPRVQASISLPYLLKLDSGHYSTGEPGWDLEVHAPNPRSTKASTMPPLLVGQAAGSLIPSFRRSTTTVSLTQDLPDSDKPDEQSESNVKQADRLLHLTNRLLRSYRAISRDATITELTLAQASPFRFQVISEGTGPLAWEPELIYQLSQPKTPAHRIRTITKRVRDLLDSGNEPEVADLFLLDAELAIQEGRFREAVLFCWSTIDSTFSRRYDQLVDSKLAGEWAEGREFFKGVDFGLKKKMSAALYLVSGRSLFREAGDLWQSLSRSYNKRNGIIHRGESANEEDARRALDVARRVVEIMGAL